MTLCYRQEVATPVNISPVTLHFHGWLTTLIHRVRRSNGLVTPALNRRTSIKDLIESFGVPHTEVGSIKINGQTVSFAHIIEEESAVEIFPSQPPVNVLNSCPLRPKPLDAIRFLVDANVGKLAGKLRMAGFDTLYDPQWHDPQLAEIAEKSQCILLSRDIQLLKWKKIEFGHFVRETLPIKQLAEVIHFYDLSHAIRPFSRCMRCNGILAPVQKLDILDQLEPLTRKYYHTFLRCSACRQIYWAGTHHEPMQKALNELRHYRPLSY
ncbi:MAG: Mut7-C ubiquitin/RNAse domain-containing protein [Proteobacteria bacterium]|nr:Mut7-C ubiquitin/RNAse domain-containing protein [Pseudomonadota bacterium]MBU1140293.1 Mut7-C ubiquitin/RNAse domain-containing protein [Pseudomonadota bacterium]